MGLARLPFSVYLTTVVLHFGALCYVGRAAVFDKVYNGTVSEASGAMQFTFNHNSSKYQAIRIHFHSPDAESDFPILLVVRQPRSVLSWTLPYVAPNNDKYHNVSHTLCPDSLEHNGSVVEENVTVVVSTFSAAAVGYSLRATFVDGYNLEVGRKLTFTSDPATPQYFQFEFPKGVDMTLVKATSKDRFCAYFSVQNAECPVFDEVSTVRYNDGSFQTMLTQAAITVQREMMKTNRFLVVLVVHPDDHMCTTGYKHITPLGVRSDGELISRTKTVTVEVVEMLGTDEYWKPILVTFVVIIAIYLLTGIIVAASFIRQRTLKDSPGSTEEREEDEDISGGEVPFAQSEPSTSNYGTAGSTTQLDSVVSNGASPSTESHMSPVRRKRAEHDSGSECDDDADIDMLDDIESTKEVYRTKMDLYVSDLSRKKPTSLEKKYSMYAWTLFTVSVFYALPVFQLVVTYQLVINVTGDQDSCYYNYMCAKPYGWFSAFNNVFSNTGYIMLGFLFLLLVWRRSYIHKNRLYRGHQREMTHGIPKHHGLLYALGWALVMEGIMSGCYHVCPNRANYQFDTAYMYIIACLGMLKMYQQRHPDINANSYASFALFALILFIGFLGLLFSSVYFYIVFFFVHMLTCLGLSAQIYYMGTVKLDWGIFQRSCLFCKSDIITCAPPTHKTRLALLTAGIIVNLSLSILGLVTQPLDFASFLLAIMIVNMLLYLSFYFIMKLICREKILLVVILFATLTVFVWASALYFYQLKETAWQHSPAESRELNTHCLVMGFFDGHDVWHFLSAFGLFVSFVSVLFLDDDLDNVPRTKIRVF